MSNLTPMRRRLVLPAAAVAACALALPALAASGPAAAGPAGTAAHCPDDNGVNNTPAVGLAVPGAQMQKGACLPDLTTTGPLGLVATAHTDESDWAGLNAATTRNPTGVPGIQLDGYFPDDDPVQQSTENGWNHDAQFVMRFPAHWNGRLVITGAPGVRKQYAADFVISDWAVAQGYAYASTDKGNSGTSFYEDGTSPGDAIAEWHQRVTELTIAAKATVKQVYGRTPRRTYMTGISNGGYLTRWQIEHHPELFDGGVDWEGTLLPDKKQGPNLFTYLPVALANYPRYAATGDQAAHDAMIKAGFAPGSEFLWADHYAEYWDLTQRTYREELDPSYDGDLAAGVPFCQAGLGIPGCDADYDYAARPKSVKQALTRPDIALTGHLTRPMLTLHGTLDALLPIRTDSDVYDRMIRNAGAGDLHRYYKVEDGNHVDGRYDAHPDQLRPILPCYRAAFTALTDWVEHGVAPPRSGTIRRPSSGDVVNTCSLPGA